MRKFRIALLLYVAFDLFILGNTAGLLPLTPLVAAQNVPNSPPIRPMPDCILTPNTPFTAIGTSAVYDNRGMGCTTWTLVYSNNGYSALNIAQQSADDAGGTPSAFTNWGTSGGTLASGTTLPLTAITSGQATGYKYRPFIRVNLSSATGSGTVWWMLYGYRPGIADSSSAGSGTVNVQGFAVTGTAIASSGNPVLMGCDTNPTNVTSGQLQNLGCNVTGALGLIAAGGMNADGQGNGVISGFLAKGSSTGGGIVSVVSGNYNGATWDRNYYCSNTTPFSVASTTTQLVALSGATKIRVCSAAFFPTTSTAGAVDLVYGTGASCGTGTTTLSGAVTLPASAVTNVPLPLTNTGALITPGGQALCVRTVTSTVAGFVTWAQY